MADVKFVNRSKSDLGEELYAAVKKAAVRLVGNEDREISRKTIPLGEGKGRVVAWRNKIKAVNFDKTERTVVRGNIANVNFHLADKYSNEDDPIARRFTVSFNPSINDESGELHWQMRISEMIGIDAADAKSATIPTSDDLTV